MPAPPTLAAPPSTVLANIFGRAANLAVRIRRHPSYADAIGQDLGIIGAEQTFDPGSMKPVLLITLQAAHPNALRRSWELDKENTLDIS